MFLHIFFMSYYLTIFFVFNKNNNNLKKKNFNNLFKYAQYIKYKL